MGPESDRVNYRVTLSGCLLEVDRCASRKRTAHSSQHTSTVLPPISTWMTLASSAQSQAAHVLLLMFWSPSYAQRLGRPMTTVRGKLPLSNSLGRAQAYGALKFSR